MENRRTISTKELVLMALMIALIFLSANIIRIPTFAGFIHLGDSMVFVSVILLGKKKGAVVSSLGMALVDMLGGYYIWAPFTFIIKGTMAYIAGVVLERLSKKKNNVAELNKNYIISFIIAGAFMVIAYFVAGTILAGFFTDKVGIVQGIMYAAKDILGNVVQAGVGVIISASLSSVIIGAKKKAFNS